MVACRPGFCILPLAPSLRARQGNIFTGTIYKLPLLLVRGGRGEIQKTSANGEVRNVISHAKGATLRCPLLLHHLFTICRLPVINQPDEVHAGVPGGNIQPDGRLVLPDGG